MMMMMKSPASCADKVSEPRMMSQGGTVREGVCAYISVFLQSEPWMYLRSSYGHMIEVGEPKDL